MTTFVLWENHAIGPVRRFGPHAFLAACVAERVPIDRFTLVHSRTLAGRACSGNANVLRQLRDERLWDDAEHIVAVLDADKLHDLLGLAGSDALRLIPDERRATWFDDREEQLRAHAKHHHPDRLAIHFLDRNLETLLEILDGPVGKKDTSARDQMLQRAAADRHLIRKAMAEMPTWATLVETVAARLMPP